MKNVCKVVSYQYLCMIYFCSLSGYLLPQYFNFLNGDAAQIYFYIALCHYFSIICRHIQFFLFVDCIRDGTVLIHCVSQILLCKKALLTNRKSKQRNDENLFVTCWCTNRKWTFANVFLFARKSATLLLLVLTVEDDFVFGQMEDVDEHNDYNIWWAK